MHIINAAGSAVWARVFDVVLIDLHEILLMYTIKRLSHRAVTMTHRRYRAAIAASRAHARKTKGAPRHSGQTDALTKELMTWQAFYSLA